MQTESVEFLIFPGEGGWKIYRDGELVAIYSEQKLAESAVAGFASEISRNGGAVVVKPLTSAEEAVAHGAEPL